MEEDLFESAKFGDKFITRNGQLAIFIRKNARGLAELIHQPEGTIFSEMSVHLNGFYINGKESETDIVSRYKEPINEDDLEKLAKANTPRIIEEGDENDFQWGFKVGYRKAKTE